MSLPTLSVIVANYNHGKYLSGAIQAMLDQSVRPLEIIVVDDASSDDSVSIIQEWCRREPSVKLIQNEENQSAAGCFNRMLPHARGEYIYGAAADDMVLPGFFEKALEMASRHPTCGMVFGDMVEVDNAGKVLNYLNLPGYEENVHFTAEEFLHDYVEVQGMTHALCGATIYRRDCMMEFGGYSKGLFFCADNFVTKAIGLKHGACYIPQPFLRWRYSPGGLANSMSPLRVRQITDLAIQRMRMPPFNEVFPEALIQKWNTQFFDDQLRNLSTKFHLLHESLQLSREQRREKAEQLFEQYSKLTGFRTFAHLARIRSLCLHLIELRIASRLRRDLHNAGRSLYLYRDPTLRRWGALGKLCDSIPVPRDQTVTVDPSMIDSQEGNCYSLSLEALGIYSPSDEESFSFLRIEEDGVPLERPHSPRELIVKEGNGRFSHWGKELHFSSMDNSDPRTNGKTYQVKLSQTLLSCLKRLRAKLGRRHVS